MGAALACALSTSAVENNPLSEPNCTAITPVGVTATSSNGAYPASAAIDNNAGTRWQSDPSDPQSLTVDLGSPQSINTVTIDWEAANAKEYWLRGSDDGETWVDIVHKTNMAMGARTDVIDGINASYRYLKMDGVARNLTDYGYSIFDFYVCADAIIAPDCAEAPIASATASSGDASLAIDNIAGSRWESAYEDPQTLTVDLGDVQLVKEVTIIWEAANAKDYTLSGSVDGTSWEVIENLTNMPEGPREDHFDGIDTGYRYLQMHGTARNLANGNYYGYSIYEFNVCVPYVPVEVLTCDTPIYAATATASTGGATAAIDGNLGTRWESAQADPQSLTVDMGEADVIDFVKIHWETANAKNYTLSGSLDGTNWSLIAIKTNMPTGERTDDIVVNGSYRYLKMDGTVRNTPYGYSIWEFEVCGDIPYAPVPAVIQSEDWYQMSGVLTETTTDTGGGLNVGYIDANDYMNYPIAIPLAGQYKLNARVASNGEGGVIEYLIDGVSKGSINVPNTGGWQTWQTVSLAVTLPAGNHMFTVRAVSPPFNINWVEVEATFIVWNGTSWDYGTPSATADAVINGPYNNSSFDVGNLTVNAGRNLTITEGNTVTVNGVLANNGSIVVQNNAALLQPDGSSYTGSGNFSAYRYSNELYRLDYTLWGSPVNGTQTLLDFSPLTSTNPSRFYTYGFDGTVELYQTITNPGSTVFNPGTGYLIRMPNILPDSGETAGYNAGNTPVTFEGEFEGTPNYGDVAVAIGNLSGHYIAVSNPYPSPISVIDFFEENASVLQAGNGIYFWRKRNNSSASSYAHLSLTGFTANGANGGDMSGENGGGFYYTGNDDSSTEFNENWIISPGQGFLVKVAGGLAPESTIVFNNSMRRSAPAEDGQPFFKTQNTNDAPALSRWWINLTGTNAFSQALTGYMPQGTTGLDYGYDAKMLADDGSAKLYSIADASNLSIQSRPVFTDTDVVPMGFSVAAAGQYNLALDRVDGVFAQGQDIYIKDNMLGTTTLLGEGGYNFTSDAGTFDNRFEVVYQTDGELGTQDPALENMVMVYQNNGAINITTGNIEMNAVTLYDIRGSRLYAQTGINATEASISNLNAAHQVIIVEINTAKGKVTKKIVY